MPLQKTCALSDGESIGDTAQALSAFADVLGIRVHAKAVGWNYPKGNELVREFVEASSIPVINLECDMYHPTQALADVATLRKVFGRIGGIRVVMAWAFGGTAMRVPAIPIDVLSLLTRLGAHTTLLCPAEFQLEDRFLDRFRARSTENGASFDVSCDRVRATQAVDVIYARNWSSTHIGENLDDELELHSRYANWTWTETDFRPAKPTCRYMHCLPVARGLEATDSVIDGPRSLIGEQMRQRRIVQKELLRLLLRDKLVAERRRGHFDAGR